MLAELLIMLGLEKTKETMNSLSMSSEPDEFGVFIDGNGDLRILPSLKKVFYGYTKYGERVIKDKKTGSTIINVDLERAKQNETSAIQKGDKFFLRSAGGGRGMYKMGNQEIEGARYCEVGKNDTILYVRRCINYINNKTNESCNGFFYMDMNYNLVSPSDELRKSHIGDKNFTKLCNKIMSEINNSNRKYLMKQDRVIYIGDANGYKYDHSSLRNLK